MREEMIGFRPFRADVLIGGMDGLFEELDLFRSGHRASAVFPMASTGGAARQIFELGQGPNDANDRKDLESSLRYRALFRQILS